MQEPTADEEVVSATVPDWGRERPRGFWDPSRRLITSFRRYQALRDGPRWIRWARRVFSIEHAFWAVVTGADLSLHTRAGGGLLMPHPNGVVINPNTVIGPNCLLFQQVTLGQGGSKPGAPVLGGHVDVGTGAKILGGVTIGDHAKIGANAVVLQDVPPGATAVGIPARIIPARPPRPVGPGGSSA
ncbi:MAG: serine acetyltransferase [Isosphaeraceae bacterium]